MTNERDEIQPADLPDTPIDPADIASAGRSCSVILILAAVTLLVICVGVGLRWAFAQ